MFISLGEKGIYYSDGEAAGLEPVPVKTPDMTNANGAGDAMFAGIVYCWLQGLNLLDTIRFAMSAAGLTMSHSATINPDMSYASVKKTRGSHLCLNY